MSRSHKTAWLAVLSLCAASALAEDGVPKFENHYSLKKKDGKGNDEPKVPVSPALAKAMTEKVARCYREEQGSPVSEEDRKLLEEFADDVARDLAAALANTPCQVEKDPTPACLDALAAQGCDALAQPIIAQGWDRNLTDAARAQVSAYAKALGAREATCEGRDAEEAAIVQGVRTDRLAALIEAQIVMGKCEMHPELQAACEKQLNDTECGEVLQIAGEGQIHTLCSDLFVCQDVKIPSEEKPSEEQK